jgi:hypothetical protein
MSISDINKLIKAGKIRIEHRSLEDCMRAITFEPKSDVIDALSYIANAYTGSGVYIPAKSTTTPVINFSEKDIVLGLEFYDTRTALTWKLTNIFKNINGTELTFDCIKGHSLTNTTVIKMAPSFLVWSVASGNCTIVQTSQSSCRTYTAQDIYKGVEIDNGVDILTVFDVYLNAQARMFISFAKNGAYSHGDYLDTVLSELNNGKLAIVLSPVVYTNPQPKTLPVCTCSLRDLFTKGCKCGAFHKENK